MNINLRSMTEEEYKEWIVVSTKQQALDRASFSNEDYEKIYEGVLKIVPILLPKGMQTENHYFYSIDTLNDKNIGYIWYASNPEKPDKSVFLLDIHLLEDYRSKGIGRVALSKAHEMIKDQGFDSVFLNVLNTNFAKKLYLSLGYSVVEEKEHNSTLVIKL